MSRPLSEWVFAARAWIALVLAAPPAWLGMLLLPRPAWRWRAMALACRLALRLAGVPVSVRGRENLADGAGPCLIVCNHCSFLDVLVLGAILPRPVRYVAKAELARSPLTRGPLKGIGTLFVERFDRRRALKDYRLVVAAAAASGPPLLFFPEGTFRPTPGVLPFQTGAFLCAAEARLPVVPIAIRGTRAILSGDSRFPRKASVAVTIGAPLPPAPASVRRHEAAMRMSDAARAFVLRETGEPDLAGDQTLAAARR